MRFRSATGSVTLTLDKARCIVKLPRDFFENIPPPLNCSCEREWRWQKFATRRFFLENFHDVRSWLRNKVWVDVLEQTGPPPFSHLYASGECSIIVVVFGMCVTTMRRRYVCKRIAAVYRFFSRALCARNLREWVPQGVVKYTCKREPTAVRFPDRYDTITM